MERGTRELVEEGKKEEYLSLTEDERSMIQEGKGLGRFEDSLTQT